LTSSDAELRFIKTSLTRELPREAPSLGPMGSDSALVLLGAGQLVGNRNPVNALQYILADWRWCDRPQSLIASRIQPNYIQRLAAMPSPFR